MKIPSLLAMACAPLACAEAKDDLAPEEEDPGEHACEQSETEGMTLEASEERNDAPSVAISEEPYNVTLPAGAAGWLKVEGPVDALLFLGLENVATGLFEGDSENDTLPEGSPNEFCADEVPEHFDLELEASESFLRLGPAAVEQVWLVLLSAEGHGHAD